MESINHSFIIKKIEEEVNQLKRSGKSSENLIRIKAYCDLLLEAPTFKQAVPKEREIAQTTRVEGSNQGKSDEQSSGSLLDF